MCCILKEVESKAASVQNYSNLHCVVPISKVRTAVILVLVVVRNLNVVTEGGGL